MKYGEYEKKNESYGPGQRSLNGNGECFLSL